MSRLPTLFVSHGAPSFAREPGRAGPLLATLGQVLPRPAAVLVVSPHWSTPNPRAASGVRPRTIHDFGSFDPALSEIRYPATGHPPRGVFATRAPASPNLIAFALADHNGLLRHNASARKRRRPGAEAQISADLSRRAFVMTETELKLIAAAAMIGESRRPNSG